MAKIYAPYEGPRWQHVRNAYEFFRRVEGEGQAFSLEELCKTTHYSVGTAQSYLSKRWHQFIQKRPQGDFVCRGILRVSWEHFANLHSQIRRLPDEETPSFAMPAKLPTPPQIEEIIDLPIIAPATMPIISPIEEFVDTPIALQTNVPVSRFWNIRSRIAIIVVILFKRFIL